MFRHLLLLLLLSALALATNDTNTTDATPVALDCTGKRRYSGCQTTDPLTVAAIAIAVIAGTIFFAWYTKKYCCKEDYEAAPTEDA